MIICHCHPAATLLPSPFSSYTPAYRPPHAFLTHPPSTLALAPLPHPPPPPTHPYTHAVWWAAAVWRVASVRGLGQDLGVPALRLRPLGQLRRLEGHLHRRQLGGGAELDEAGVQGRFDLARRRPQARHQGACPHPPTLLPPSYHPPTALRLTPAPSSQVLTKTCDSTTLTPDKFDLATVTVVDGKVKYTQLSEAEAQKLLDAFKEDSASGDA